MRKKLLVISLTTMFALILSACGNQASATAAATAAPVSATAAAASSVGSASLDDVASQSLQLAVGIINLRSTQTPIDAAQAASLIPLLQSYQTLLTGTTYDASQVQSALDAIKAVLTADQIKAISDMGTLTLDNLTMGGRNGQPNANGTPDPNMVQGTPGANGGPGPSGTPGAGGQGPQAQGTPGADGKGGSMQTTIDNIKSATVAPGLNPDLIGLVVTSLQMTK